MRSDVFRAIGDPTRRAVIELLREGERSATELAAPFDVSRPAISQHLQVLREAGLVEVRKEGRLRLYRLNPEPLAGVFDWVAHYLDFWPTRLEALRQFMDEG